MMLKERRINVNDLVRVANAVKLLQTTRGGSLGPRDSDSDAELEVPLRNPSREAANRILELLIVVHIYAHLKQKKRSNNIRT